MQVSILIIYLDKLHLTIATIHSINISVNIFLTITILPYSSFQYFEFFQ